MLPCPSPVWKQKTVTGETSLKGDFVEARRKGLGFGQSKTISNKHPRREILFRLDPDGQLGE